MEGLNPVRKIVYQGSKDCQGLSEKGNKYNIPHLKVSLETVFSKMIRTHKKVFILRWGKCTINSLYPSLPKQFVLSICIRNSMKTQPWAIFARVRTAKYIADGKYDDSSEDNYCVPFFKSKFLIPTLSHIFYSAKHSNIYRECDFVSSVTGNKLRQYTFLRFF